MIKTITLIAFFTGFTLHAQQAIVASGGNATGTGGSASYSIGQVVYTTHTGSNGSISQGVQHAYEIFTLGIKDTTMNISLIAFPNPTIENLTLQVNDYNNEQLIYRLFDIQGKLLSNGKIVAQQTQIVMGRLPAATYLVHVVNQTNKKIQSFKIIKTQ